MSIPLLGPPLPPFSQYLQEQSSMAAASSSIAEAQSSLSGSMPLPAVHEPGADLSVQEIENPAAGDKHGFRHAMSSFYLDGIYAFWESKRGEETKEVVVPEAAHWRSVQQRAEAQRYKEEQVEKAKRVALKAQNAAERAERHRLRGESNLSSFSLRSLPSSINRFRSRVWSGQKTLGQMKEAPSRERSPANLQGLAAADVQEAKSGDHHRVTRAHSTPAPAPAAAADAGPSRPSTGRKNSPKPIGTRTITHGRYDSGHHEACQGTNFGEGRMGLVVKKKASMASSRSKYSQPESAEVVGQRKREQDGEGIEGMERF